MISRFSELILVALKRVVLMANTYEQQARLSHDRWSRRYLFFLAAKKREQQVAFERLGRNEKLEVSLSDLLKAQDHDLSADQLHCSSLREIFEYACKAAGRDLAIFYEACEEEGADFRARALQSMLIRSVKKSFGDIRTGYLRFVTRQEAESNVFAYQEKDEAILSVG